MAAASPRVLSSGNRIREHTFVDLCYTPRSWPLYIIVALYYYYCIVNARVRLLLCKYRTEPIIFFPVFQYRFTCSPVRMRSRPRSPRRNTTRSNSRAIRIQYMTSEKFVRFFFSNTFREMLPGIVSPNGDNTAAVR